MKSEGRLVSEPAQKIASLRGRPQLPAGARLPADLVPEAFVELCETEFHQTSRAPDVDERALASTGDGSAVVVEHEPSHDDRVGVGDVIPEQVQKARSTEHR